jgi:hypothetical protein
MINKIKLILISIFFSSPSFCQDLSQLNNYKYVIVQTATYQNAKTDAWGVSYMVRNFFSNKGYIVLNETERSTINSCEILECNLNHTLPNSVLFTTNYHEVKVEIKNCNNQILYTGIGTYGEIRSSNSQAQTATEYALSKLKNFKYSYNSFSRWNEGLIEKSNENEESIKQYLSKTNLDPIEGIYKSYQNSTLGYYKIGIILKDEVFKAIVIESDNNTWKCGEVKAIIEKSALKNIYSTKWFMADKSVQETFSNLENDAILSIDLKVDNSGKNISSQFIKVYPNTNQVEKGSNWSASGSGFFISNKGLIATNAHVVKDSKNIEVTVLENEISKKNIMQN